MEPLLLVGCDELTVVLHLLSPVDSKDWGDIADSFIQEFIERSKITELFGRLTHLQTKIPAGYTEALTVMDVNWYFAIGLHEHFQNMGVIVKFSAEAWAWYQKEFTQRFNEPMNAARFYQIIQSDVYKARISRIDLTADYYNYGKSLTPNAIYDSLVTQKVLIMDSNERVARRKLTHYGKDGIVESIVIGSKKENTKSICRIYDKKLEQINKNGFRLSEAHACDTWTRFEASYRGNYAWQIGGGLLEVRNETELEQLIAAKITEKYRFFKIETDDYTVYTNDLLEIVSGQIFNALRSEHPEDNELWQSIHHLIKGSGLFPTLYKIGWMWGADAEKEFLETLYNIYQTQYEPFAEKDRKLVAWCKKHYSALHPRKLSDCLYPVKHKH